MPIIGWMIPLYLDAENESSQFHGKQGFVINRLGLLMLAIWWVIGNFIPTYYNAIYDALLWGILAIYIAILLWGLVLAYTGKYHLPYLGKIANQIKL